MTVLLPKLPPGADVVFRRLFNEEDACRLLISLLNAVLRYPVGKRITEDGQNKRCFLLPAPRATLT